MGLRSNIVKNHIEKVKSIKLEEPLTIEEASPLIYDKLMGDKPCMIARFGQTEMDSIVRYLAIKEKSNWLTKPFWNLVGWNKQLKERLSKDSGFFSNSTPNVERFCELTLDCALNIDLIASWAKGENIIQDRIGHIPKIPLYSLEPFHCTPPWSRALKGKKVLVIHPYSETIMSQYENSRKYIFENEDILPKFELKTIKAVQSIAHEKVDFKDWFEALEHMKCQIREADFDIAIIGCGAYGLPLAAYVKELGKKFVHIGGSTQLLFGIKGGRWDGTPAVAAFYNEYWVRPNKSETPKKANAVEDGCYW